MGEVNCIKTEHKHDMLAGSGFSPVAILLPV